MSTSNLALAQFLQPCFCIRDDSESCYFMLLHVVRFKQSNNFKFLLLILQSFDCLAALHLELLQVILFIAVLLSAPVFLTTCFNYCNRGLPTAFFFWILLLQGCLLQNGYA